MEHIELRIRKDVKRLAKFSVIVEILSRNSRLKIHHTFSPIVSSYDAPGPPMRFLCAALTMARVHKTIIQTLRGVRLP